MWQDGTSKNEVGASAASTRKYPSTMFISQMNPSSTYAIISERLVTLGGIWATASAMILMIKPASLNCTIATAVTVRMSKATRLKPAANQYESLVGATQAGLVEVMAFRIAMGSLPVPDTE
jgi:hypothetical protein